jgi:hypothetical protein
MYSSYGGQYIVHKHAQQQSKGHARSAKDEARVLEVLFHDRVVHCTGVSGGAAAARGPDAPVTMMRCESEMSSIDEKWT